MKNDVIRKINPDVVTIRGDVAYDANEQVIEIDQAAYDAEVARLEAEHNATQYQRDRKAEYPSIEECVHAILDGELDALQALRAEIKARYPKP
jgi:glycerol-3-phosphate cytidylyltransferase-like family protein